MEQAAAAAAGSADGAAAGGARGAAAAGSADGGPASLWHTTPPHDLDHLVLSYLHHRGLHSAVARLKQTSAFSGLPDDYLLPGRLGVLLAPSKAALKRSSGSGGKGKPKNPPIDLKPDPPPAPTGYALFCRERRDETKLSDGPERRRVLKSLFATLTKAQQQAYHDRCAQAREAYYQAHPSKRPKGVPELKKRKDPNAPKRPMSAYVMYTLDMRPLVAERHPLMQGPTAMMGLLAKMWKDSDEATKAKYHALYVQDKNRYAREMAHYQPPPVTYILPKKKKRRFDPHWPRRATTAYLCFVAQRWPIILKENPGILQTDGFSEIAKQWKQLSDEERAPFVAEAARDKARYKRQCESYAPAGKAKATRKRRKNSGKTSSKGIGDGRPKELSPPKRPMSAYLHFARAVRPAVKKDMAGSHANDVLKEIAKRWARVTGAEKQVYLEKAAVSKQEYLVKVREWEKTRPQGGAASGSKSGAGMKKPKRAITAFHHFSGEMRPQILAEHPSMKTTDVVRELGDRWRKISAKDKARFEKLADKSRAEYRSKMADYEARNKVRGSVQQGEKMSAFDYYCEEKRATYTRQNPEATPQQILDMLQMKFNTMPAERMVKYTSLAAGLASAR